MLIAASGAVCNPNLNAGFSGLAAASWAVAASLILLVLSTFADFFLAGKKSAGEGICTAVWRHLNIGLLGWGLLVASLVWQGYELFANGMGADARSGLHTNCPKSFYNPMVRRVGERRAGGGGDAAAMRRRCGGGGGGGGREGR